MKELARIIGLTAIALFLTADAALACPICFGAVAGPVAEGMNAAIFLLLGVTGAVLAAFVAFFFHLAKRSKMVWEAQAEHNHKFEMSDGRFQIE